MLSGVLWLMLSYWTVNAATSTCLNIKFDNSDNVCLGLSKGGSKKEFEISVDKKNLSSNASLRCNILLPNSKILPLNWCKWSFSYNGTSTQSVTVYATYTDNNNRSHFKRLEAEVNFKNGTWESSNNVINSSSSSSSSHSSASNNYIKLSTNRKSPSTNQYVNLTIETDDDYTGKLNLSAKYKSSSSSSWTSISNTSSSYFNDYNDEWEDGYYKMRSSDDWEVTLKDIVKFRKDGYYRIYVKDTDGNESYIQFTVWDTSSSSSSSNDDLRVSASPSNPDTNEWVKLTIETDDDYTGKVKFTKLQYRSSSSSSWSSVSMTSTTYVSDYSTEWSNGYYKMKSSDDGEVTLSKLIKFKKKWYYRIYVEDTDGNDEYVQISVDTSSSSRSDDLSVSASPSKPDTNEWIKLTIETDDDYTGKIKFTKLQYRSSSSSSWSTVSMNSSTYVANNSSEWSNWYYKMKSSDDGRVTLKNLVKFKKRWYYRIHVEDTDGNDAYVQISVDTSWSSSSSDEIDLSTNRKSPSTNQYVNLTIETDDDYTGKLKLSAKYRSSSSSSWTSISNTSSTYFNDYSDEWEDGYYKMRSSDDWEVTLKNLVKFRKNGYYRIYVKDTDGNESYLQFAVWNVRDDDEDSKESDVSGFSNKELSKVKSVYKEWNSMIAQMQRKYPALKKDNYWIRLSENFYDDMKDVINNKKSRDFDDYEDFEDAFDEWYEYTMRNI